MNLGERGEKVGIGSRGGRENFSWYVMYEKKNLFFKIK